MYLPVPLIHCVCSHQSCYYNMYLSVLLLQYVSISPAITVCIYQSCLYTVHVAISPAITVCIYQSCLYTVCVAISPAITVCIYQSCLYTVYVIIIIIAFKGAIRDFLQSPHSAANCLQHVRSSGQGAIVFKSRATHRALITCHLVRRGSSAIKFDRVEIAFI